MKITFIGDIMCEKPLQRYYNKHPNYDFGDIFKETKNLFSNSDLVVGNLETVFAGENVSYTNHIYNFNTPDQFARAMKQGGIDIVTTATNHCLDRGIAGLVRTLDILDQNKIDHTGTYRNKKERNTIYYKEIDNKKIAFLSYTYGTNTHETNVILKKEQLYHLNLLKPQTYNLQKVIGQNRSSAFRKMIARLLGQKLSLETKMKIKRKMHMTYNVPRVDILSREELDSTYLEQIKSDIIQAKKETDFVVACVHMGGQFNSVPGEFSEYIMNFFVNQGVDLIIGTHPHVVQKYETINNTPIAYCLGNYSISPSSVYLLDEYKPEYSIAMHVYLKNDNIQISKITFSILKIIEEKNGKLTVWPIDQLYKKLGAKEKEKLKKDAVYIYNRFLNLKKNEIDILKEYRIPDKK